MEETQHSWCPLLVKKRGVSPQSKLICGGKSFHDSGPPTVQPYTMRKTDYNYEYYQDHLHYERSDRVTISMNTAYRSKPIRWSIPMTNSDQFGWRNRMTPNILSAVAKLNLHPAIQQSVEQCTGRYENGKFHISSQAVTRWATEQDFIPPPTRVHPRPSVQPSVKFPPSTDCASHTRSFIDPASLGRASEITGFMPKGPVGQRVAYIYILL